MLRRSWYFDQLERSYPWLIERSKPEVEAFLIDLEKFEHGLAYDPRLIEFRYVTMINSFIERSIGDRPVYVMPEIEPEFGTGYHRVPEGLAFRL